MDASAGVPSGVPFGDGAERWRTFTGKRTLIAAARTVTSTVRLLETLPPLVRNDPRITVVFAHDPGSAFGDGVPDLLRTAGCRTIPWSQLGSATPDLIVSASENIDVPEGDCPVLVLPHGVGFQKMVPDSRTPRARLSGVVPDALLESGRAWLAVSHPDQEKQLLAARPKAVGRTVVIGDPVLDELLVSKPRAMGYKHSLGVTADQRLVVLSSTWGPTSLLGRHPGLPARLLAALPYDAFRVAAIVHPNVWAAHGAWQIRALLADALDAGLLLVNPVHAWRSALVAADAVIGDHGSVTLYGAALGKPLLLGTFGDDSVPGTAIARLGETAARLDHHGDMRLQVEAAAAGHEPDRYAGIAASAFADPGRALTRLRTLLYGLLDLAEHHRVPPPVLALPRPDPQPSAVTAWTVETTATPGDGRWTVTTRRYPAVVRHEETHDDEGPAPFVHLACDEAERDTRLNESASVLVRHHAAPTRVTALRWIRDTLDSFPGARIAATPLGSGGHLVGVHDGRVVAASLTGPAIDAGLAAAVVYTCLRARIPLDGASLTLRIDGVRDLDVLLHLRPSDPGQAR